MIRSIGIFRVGSNKPENVSISKKSCYVGWCHSFKIAISHKGLSVIVGGKELRRIDPRKYVPVKRLSQIRVEDILPKVGLLLIFVDICPTMDKYPQMWC